MLQDCTASTSASCVAFQVVWPHRIVATVRPTAECCTLYHCLSGVAAHSHARQPRTNMLLVPGGGCHILAAGHHDSINAGAIAPELRAALLPCQVG